MKIYFKILLTVFAIIIVFLGASVGIGLGAKRINSDLTLSGLFNTEYRLTAHRGFSSVAPENTAPALAEQEKRDFTLLNSILSQRQTGYGCLSTTIPLTEQWTARARLKS